MADTTLFAIDVISTVGFPIAAFLLLYRMLNETIKENTQALIELRTEIRKIHNNGK